MINLLTPSPSPCHSSMSSQDNALQDLSTYSGRATFVGGSDNASANPDTPPRHDYLQSSPLTSEMGLRYMINPTIDDVPFSSETGTSSPGYSIETSLPSSNPSSVAFSPFSNVFQPQLNSATAYTNSGWPSYSPSSPFSMSDIKPRLSTINAPPGMAPQNRSPALPHPASPISTREIYTTSTPHLRRSADLISGSQVYSGGIHPRGAPPLSPLTSPGYGSPSSMDSAGASPPLGATEPLFELRSSDGQRVQPELMGKIEKGFFLADNDWTCYRRNYFSLTCSYTLQPHSTPGSIHVIRSGASSQVYQFAMSISAVVDERDGKAIELVQHTPKRDKGPLATPDRVVLAPRPASSSMYGSPNDGMASGQSLFEQRFGQHAPQQPPTEYTFDRIQFKQATANNGKRRAAQQYYHLLVELYADTGVQMGDQRWIKVAVRMSAPMVVRGRSPGHYQHERRGSTSSNGPGGGVDGGGSGYGSGGTSNRSDHMSMSNSSSMTQGGMGGYSGSYDRNHHSMPTGIGYSQIQPLSMAESISIPSTMPMITHDDHRMIMSENKFTYHPSTWYEGTNGSTSASGSGLPRSSTTPSTSLSSYSSTYSYRDSSAEREYKTDGGNTPAAGGGTSALYSQPYPKVKNEFAYRGSLSLPGVDSLSGGDVASKDLRNYRAWNGFGDSAAHYAPLLTGTEVDT